MKVMYKENIDAFGLFNDSYPPMMDGVAVAVHNYAFWLNKKGENVKVVTPKTAEKIQKEDFEVLRYTSLPLVNRKPYRLGIPYVDVNFLNRLFIKSGFKLVHAHCPFSSGHLALHTSKIQKIPFVATFHSKYRDDFERATKSLKAANAVLKTVMPFFDHADEVWIPQAAVEETIREYGYKGKVEVVDNGTDFVTDEPIERVKLKAKKKINIPESDFVFLFVGQHIWEKNTKMIIEALDLLRDLPYQMFFVGAGYAAEDMQQMVIARELEHKIFFKGSIYDREVLKAYYAAADLFLFPSLYDNAPLVVREAAALHTPAIITAGSTTSEIITDNFNGFLIENTAIALAEKIRTIIQNKSLLSAVGDNASKTVAHSWENITNEVLDRYKHLIARKSNETAM